ncbi:MAG: cytochrome c biogenesis CcdA family protein, partial [Tumebacillaceae bacterium]
MLQSSNPTFIIAFVAGLLSFISPCVLPLYPSYLSYITGISYDEMHADGDRSLVRRRSLMHSLFFCLGFSIIFVALGFTSSMVGTLFLDYSTLIRQIGAILIIVMGLFLSGLLKIDFLYKQAKFQLKSKPVGYLGAIVVGISCAAGWTPCIGPILASVLAIAASNPVSGVTLMLFYSI